MISRGRFFLNSDIFSIGKIAYILVTGEYIPKNTSFFKVNDIIEKINCSIQYKTFIYNCLRQRLIRYNVIDAFFYVERILLEN